MRKAFVRAALTALLAVGAVAPLQAGEAVPQIGQAAPGFELPVTAGKKVSLKDFQGKWLVLYFYPKDMTPGCTIEAQRFQRDLEQYKQLGAEVVGVSADAVDSHNMFSKKEGLTFTLASDVGGKVARAYDSWYGMGELGVAARNTYLIDPQGRVAKVFSRVDPTSHSAEVLTALKQAQSKSASR